MPDNDIEAWVIYAESPGGAPRATDDPLFPWGWGEAIAVLPPDTPPAARAAALAAVAQTTHFANDDRSDILQFADSRSYLSQQANDEYVDALHPYLAISPARSLRYEPAADGESRGRVMYEKVRRVR